MKNVRIFKIKFLGATEVLGSRVSIRDCRFRESVIIPYNYEFNSSRSVAIDYLKKRGIPVCCSGELDDVFDVIISPDFEISLNMGKIGGDEQ